MAILFDLDGTLMNPQGGIRLAIDAAFAAGGVEPIQPDENFVGMPLDAVLLTRSEDLDVLQTMADAFRKISVQAVRSATWYPGMEAVVAQHAPVGVVTLKSEEELHSQLGAYDYWGALIGGDTTTPKPSPAPVLEGCKRMAADPHKSIMVGDTHMDMEAGKAAGCTTIGVTWGFGFPEGDYRADSADMLNRLLADLHNG